MEPDALFAAPQPAAAEGGGFDEPRAGAASAWRWTEMLSFPYLDDASSQAVPFPRRLAFLQPSELEQLSLLSRGIFDAWDVPGRTEGPTLTILATPEPWIFLVGFSVDTENKRYPLLLIKNVVPPYLLSTFRSGPLDDGDWHQICSAVQQLNPGLAGYLEKLSRLDSRDLVQHRADTRLDKRTASTTTPSPTCSPTPESPDRTRPPGET